jgi:selenocysteine lyase/cysteine desulfurase
MEAIWARVASLAGLLRAGLGCIPQVRLHDLGAQKCGIVTFTVGNLDPQEVRCKLKENRVNVSVSLAEYSRLDMDRRGLNSVVRASVHYYNTEAEVERFCELVDGLGWR